MLLGTEVGLGQGDNVLDGDPRKKNPRWRRPQSWKIEKPPYLSRSLSDDDELAALIDTSY